MDLFESPGAKLRKKLRFLLPVLFMIVLCMVFLACINRTSGETLQKEQSTLEQALRNGAIHTYALTGSYPESLSQLLENYQISYDSKKFVVDYVPSGSNLFPMISVIPLGNGKGGTP